jgi:hypothetical protein
VVVFLFEIKFYFIGTVCLGAERRKKAAILATI